MTLFSEFIRALAVLHVGHHGTSSGLQWPKRTQPVAVVAGPSHACVDLAGSFNIPGMTYTLAAWEGDPPTDDEHAGVIFGELLDRWEDDGIAPTPRILEYV